MLIFIGVQVKIVIVNAQNVLKQCSDLKSYSPFEVIFSDHIANNLKLWGMHRSLAKQDKC
jgi:hypothetical protein